ncbi:DUF262 domain-containing protein [Oxobacter pfennigii]|nr:DUF262 domain-containing protein [Oxobacter pfennigii]
MNEQLITLSKVFSERIFRIPDYQRGYAWTEKEVMEFWSDLLRLSDNKNHYVGVLTLEPVQESTYSQWVDDLWLIRSKKFSPYYIVDGQQRLTTSILLIKAIINLMNQKNIDKLNYTSSVDISKRFIAESKDENKSNSYLFGYEIANPSYSYLVDYVYSGKTVDKLGNKETTYTLNLKNALAFFEKELKKLNQNQLEQVYTKITQHFLFNTYEISSDIDVFVTFETMNNRGKPLSYLELLKNRLIYLSTLFTVSDDIKTRLRRDINDCWKDIYHVLGQGKTNYLPDDEFLDAHFHIYFCHELSEISKKYRRQPYFYQANMLLYDYLLDEYFVTEKVFASTLKTNDIIDYIDSLKESIKTWFYFNNPSEAGYSEDIVEYIRKINYLFRPQRIRDRRYVGRERTNPYKVLILVCLQNAKDEKTLLKFLRILERYIFLKELIPFECYDGDFSLFNLDITDMLIKLDKGDLTVVGISEKIDKITTDIVENDTTTKNLIAFYKRNGFYNQNFLRYFLCEYEVSLMKSSKADIEKLNRDVYFNKGYNSIEHIYPQRARQDYWLELFKSYTQKQRSSLRNSLGNFVAVSEAKNGRLGNKPFPEKKNGNHSFVGYKYGTYAEIELTECDDWGADEIKKRGLKLINFLNDRWKYKIGNSTSDKLDFLGLSFLKSKSKKV